MVKCGLIQGREGGKTFERKGQKERNGKKDYRGRKKEKGKKGLIDGEKGEKGWSGGNRNMMLYNQTPNLRYSSFINFIIIIHIKNSNTILLIKEYIKPRSDRNNRQSIKCYCVLGSLLLLAQLQELRILYRYVYASALHCGLATGERRCAVMSAAKWAGKKKIFKTVILIY